MTKFCYEATKEQTLFIDLPDTNGLKIKGILRGELTQPLVVMMHGRPSDGNHRLQYLGARYLYEHGFSSLRLFMYDFEPNTRNLLNCTLQTHADDFDAVIRYVRNQAVPKVFGVGHSYGGITVLKAKEKLDGAVLWEPTHGLIWHDEAYQKEEAQTAPEKIIDDFNIGLAGPGYVEPHRMVKEDNELKDNSKWAARKSYPLKFIAAPGGVLKDYIKLYAEVADEPKAYVEISGAGHSFDESDDIMLQLFVETVSWLERYR